MNDSGVENCSFLRNEALCSIKPPRILLNDVPLNITINRTLFNQTEHNLDENIVNATVSSGLGSMVNDNNLSALNRTVASQFEQLTRSSDDEIEDDDAMATDMDHSPLNKAFCLIKPPKLLLNDVPFDASINQPKSNSFSNASDLNQTDAKISKTYSKYSIEDDVIIIESDDEVDSIDTKLNQFLENYNPTISESRLKALHDISMEVINAEKQKSPKRTMNLFNDISIMINQPQLHEVNNCYGAEVIDLSEDDDLFNTTLERVDNIIGDYKPTISESRLKALHDIGMEVVNVEKRKSPKRTMSLFSEMPNSIAEMRRQRPSKRTISVEQFI